MSQSREENAARAYNKAAIRFYGDKANLNKLDEAVCVTNL